MKITVKLFASFKEAARLGESAVEVAPGATAASVWGRLVEEYPALRPLGSSAAFAVNGRYAAGETPLRDGDVVAYLPPVSGG